MTDSKGWDVVVHFNSKEDADKFEESVVDNESVYIPDDYPDNYNSLQAAFVEALECPR